MKEIRAVESMPILKIPVLFLLFNRMDTTKQVFEAIRKAKPARLYIACDGAHKEKKKEADKVNAIRDYVLTNIDWDCEVNTLFRDNNLGCKRAVSEAITWFFKHESQGIILEDDCLPSQSFFWFCEEMLNHYKDDLRVWHISGNNFQWGKKRGSADYYFSNYTHIWGWATWADRWKEYDVTINTLKEFKKTQQIKNIFDNRREQKFWLSAFEMVNTDKISAWDYQWSYCAFINHGLSILPNKNLVKNIGFSEGATHTHDLESKMANIATNELVFPIEHPKFIIRNKEADKLTAVDQFEKKYLFTRVLRKIKSLV